MLFAVQRASKTLALLYKHQAETHCDFQSRGLFGTHEIYGGVTGWVSSGTRSFLGPLVPLDRRSKVHRGRRSLECTRVPEAPPFSTSSCGTSFGLLVPLLVRSLLDPVGFAPVIWPLRSRRFCAYGFAAHLRSILFRPPLAGAHHPDFEVENVQIPKPTTAHGRIAATCTFSCFLYGFVQNSNRVVSW